MCNLIVGVLVNHCGFMPAFGLCLRWLKTVSSTFQDLDFDVSL